VDRAADVALGFRLAVELLAFLERHGGENRPMPRPEIFGGNVFAADVPQVTVDIGRGQVARLPVILDVRKQLLSREILTGGSLWRCASHGHEALLPLKLNLRSDPSIST
jgi:hypothetical protein